MSLDRMSMHSRQELQTYIATAEDVCEELYQFIGRDLGVDFESLDILESFLLNRYPTVDSALGLDQRGVVDAAARHVGLVLVLGIDGARWDLDLDNERNVYYRLPLIALPDGSQECPITMVTASLDRRTGTFMRDVAKALAEDCAAPAKARPTRKAKPRPKAKAKPKPKPKPKPKAKRG